VSHLSSPAIQMLQALFGMGLLSFVMFAWMSLVRLPAMRRAGLTLQDAAHTADLPARMPTAATQVADNYNHLMEAPTVYYAVVLAIVAAGISDTVYAGCAWAFLFMRIAHSLVQATFNKVAVRALLYGLSWLVLAVLIVRPLLTLALAG